ncbi:MAG: hypothetical protein FJZ01_27780, partial [Candidatus Sericytochromatia bacterium]|nr:hypothetical protein [Candidatus Tanganyikabacteria bacterium]
MLSLLPILAAGCHKLGAERVVLQTVTLTGTAVAPADQVVGVLPAGPASLIARRGRDANVPLAYARIEALDAALRPVPGVAAARTDAAGRYVLDVPAGRPYVLRFSVGEVDHHLDVMALAQASREYGTQVVNADPASHVAAHVLLERSGGLDGALAALGAPELQGVVEFVRRGLSAKVPALASVAEVKAVVAAGQQAEELSPVLARVDAAKARAVVEESRMITTHSVAEAPATPSVPAPPVAAAPSPSPSPTAAPVAAADPYRVDPPAEQAEAPAPPARPTTAARRRASGQYVDP